MATEGGLLSTAVAVGAVVEVPASGTTRKGERILSLSAGDRNVNQENSRASPDKCYNESVGQGDGMGVDTASPPVSGCVGGDPIGTKPGPVSTSQLVCKVTESFAKSPTASSSNSASDRKIHVGVHGLNATGTTLKMSKVGR